MKNLNADFLLDIWADVKAKNLAPVAIGLLVALVAIPALLLKGEEGVSDGPLPIAASASPTGAEVEVAEELAEGDSKLDSYKARDPFKGRVAPEGDTAGDGLATVPGAAPGGTGGTSAGATPELPKSLGSLGGSPGPPAIPNGGSTGELGDSTTPQPPASSPPIKQRNHRYNYQLDLRFGRPGREKRYRGVTRLTFLPNEKLPALLFMGVPVAEKSALFFVHPGLTHQGQGECVPSRTNCSFLELELGEEHYLAANDFEFRIELQRIKRVKLSEEKAARAASSKASEGRRSGRSTGEGDGDAGTSGKTGYDQSALPWLVDGGLG